MEEYAKLAQLAAEVGVSNADEWTFAHPWNAKPSPEMERGMLQHYCRKFVEWSATEGKWCLMLGIFYQDQIIGMQDAWSRNPYPQALSAETGSWIARSFQGKRFGKEARGGILHLFFDHLGAREMYSGAFKSNKASLAVSKYWGYQPNGVHLQTVEGKAGAQSIKGLRITQWRWAYRSLQGYQVEGLEPCLPMFGLKSA